MDSRPGLTSQFLSAASKAKKVEHNLFCSFCCRETDHDLSVRGDWEYYVCPDCGTCQSFKVR